MNRLDALAYVIHVILLMIRIVIIVYLWEVRKKKDCGCPAQWKRETLLWLLVASFIVVLIPHRIARSIVNGVFTLPFIIVGLLFISEWDSCACIQTVEPTWVMSLLRWYIYAEVAMLITLTSITILAHVTRGPLER